MANTEDVKPQNMLWIALDRIWRMKAPERVEMSCCPCCLVHCAAQIGIHTPNGMRSHRVRLWSWKLWREYREYLKLVKICEFWWGTLSTWTCAVSLCAGWSGRLKGHGRVAFQDAALQWKSQCYEWHQKICDPAISQEEETGLDMELVDRQKAIFNARASCPVHPGDGHTLKPLVGPSYFTW